MCWYIGKNPNVKIAERDIEVFKVVEAVDGRILPYFFHNKDVYGLISNGVTSIIGDGVHSSGKELEFEQDYDGYVCRIAIHSYLKSRLTLCYYDKPVFRIAIEDGAKRIYTSYYGSEAAIMKCVIPKGVKYAVNEIGEVVSEAIQVKNIVFPLKKHLI